MIPTPPALHIRTPDGIEFSVPLAGITSRSLAWVIDAVFTLVLSTGLAVLISVFALATPALAQALGILAFFLLQVGYGMAFELFWRGQTPGKRALGLRVADAQGLRLTPSQVVLRNLLRPVDSLPLAYLVGGLSILGSRHAQRLGDLAAGTVVTRAQRPFPLAYATVADTGPNSLRAFPHLAARLRQRVPPTEAAAALAALVRRDRLTPAARLDLFEAMATHFRSLVPFPPEAVESLTDEAYVRAVVDLLHRPTLTGSGTQASARSGPDPSEPTEPATPSS